MREVLCWCCQYYLPADGDNNTTEIGYCELTKLKVEAYDKVCEKFQKIRDCIQSEKSPTIARTIKIMNLYK